MLVKNMMQSMVGNVILLLWCLGASPIYAQQEPIQSLSMPENLDERKVALGERLFNEPRLSADDTISCGNCHVLSIGGVDKLAVATGIGGAQGKLNSPTVFNSGNNFRQFWDGRTASLEEQVSGPIHNPVEMGANWLLLENKLRAIPELVEMFDQIYPDGITRKNITDSIAEFERSLVTLGAPFDEWLEGREDALTEREIRGYQLFKSYGCIACHQGRNVGSNLYAQMGLMGDYFADRNTPVTKEDMGHFNVTGKEWDRYYFKVPSLRLAGRTAPYFHDGSVNELADAVVLMGRYQLGRRIPEQDLQPILSFLRSLEGRHPALNSSP